MIQKLLSLIGTTALHMAVRERNMALRTRTRKDVETPLDLVRFLLGENVDPSPRMRTDGQTPLHMAVNERQNIRVIELLVGFGADVNARYVSEFVSPFYIQKTSDDDHDLTITG